MSGKVREATTAVLEECLPAPAADFFSAELPLATLQRPLLTLNLPQCADCRWAWNSGSDALSRVEELVLAQTIAAGPERGAKAMQHCANDWASGRVRAPWETGSNRKLSGASCATEKGQRGGRWRGRERRR
jgi:hypothetical protein